MVLILPKDIRTAPLSALAAKSRPVDARLPEAMPYVLYDTQQYPAAGVAHLDFFANVNGDRTMSNLETPGSLPAPQFFDIHRIFLDFLAAPSATIADTAAGVGNDVELILKSARATWTLTTKSKPLGPIPATFLGRSGAANIAFGTGRAAPAGAVIQAVQGPDNGGFPVNGSITLSPSSRFVVGMDFVAGIAISGNLNLRVSLMGILYRSVG